MKFVLQPCHVRADRVAPDKSNPVVLHSIHDLVEKFRPSTPGERLQIRSMRLGAYVGLIRGSQSGNVVPFVLWNRDRSNKIKWLLKKDPKFPTRLVEIYRVEEADWGSKFNEFDTGVRDAPTWQGSKTPGMMEARR